jgi:hypothetical protein
MDTQIPLCWYHFFLSQILRNAISKTCISDLRKEIVFFLLKESVLSIKEATSKAAAELVIAGSRFGVVNDEPVQAASPGRLTPTGAPRLVGVSKTRILKVMEKGFSRHGLRERSLEGLCLKLIAGTIQLNCLVQQHSMSIYPVHTPPISQTIFHPHCIYVCT